MADEPGGARRSRNPADLDRTGIAGSMVTEVSGAWLRDLPGTDEHRSRELRAAYRQLAEIALNVSLGDRKSESGPDLREARGLEAALAAVTAEGRRLGSTITHVVDDVSRLTTTAVRWLRAHRPGGPADADRLAESVVVTMAFVTRRLTRLMESSAVRARRERYEGIAAMTDILSHELRNRLGAARTASQLLVDPDIRLDETRMRRALELIVQSVEDAERTVEDVGTLAAAAAGHSDSGGASARTMELGALVRRVVNDLEPTALDAGVRIEIEEMCNCPVDVARTRLILFNLIGNAIKYRDRGKADPRVRISGREVGGGERAEVAVADNGVGIPESELADVFAYRVRGDDIAEDLPGSGLGLAIVSEAVEQLGGEIRVESEEGVGTTFRLRFTPPRSGPPSP